MVITPPRIARLTEAIVNQIAAGEVIERPASVIKELVENSLDAGAHSIEVHVKDGGMSEILILDDGLGIEKDDLPLALERHATSKIRQESDLESIQSYGFRGEALSSIAAVSLLELSSRTRHSSTGFQLISRFGISEGELKPVGIPAGTQIKISDLFGRLPARKKYMRSLSTEYSHCARTLRELALGRPDVAFSLFHQGKQVSVYGQSSPLERYLNCMSPHFEPMELKAEEPDMRLEAYLSPQHCIQDRGELYFYLNGRVVRNRGFMSAIRQAYLSTLGPHHEPSGVVFLSLEPSWVDVNVHPQKWEVRCYKPERIYGWITNLIRKRIGEDRTIRSYVSPLPPPAERSPRIEEATRAYFIAPEPLRELQPPRAVPPQPTLHQTDFFSQVVEKTSETLPPAPAPSRFQYLGQIRASYLICADEFGLCLFDQHALHEKLAYEALKRDAETKTLPSQQLLIPKIVRISSEMIQLFEAHHGVFEKAGFAIDSFGDSELAIRSMPTLCSEAQAEKVFLECLRAIQDEGIPSVERAFDHILATTACHSVVRAGTRLSDTEANALLAQVPLLQEGWTCPHGRNIVFRVSYPQIEKHFERR